MDKNKVIGVGLALTGAVMFSAKAIFVKVAYGIQPELDPVTLIMYRMLFALPFYAVILTLELRKRKDIVWEKITMFKIFVMGFVGYYLASFFDFWGLQYIDASLERVVLYVYPTFVLILSFLLNKKKIKPMQLLAIAITYLGVIVAFQGRIDESDNLLFGTILIVLCSLAYALYLVGSEQLVERIGPKLLTSAALIVSSVCVLVHKYITMESTLSFSEVDPRIFGISLGVAIFSTVIPSFMISEAIRRVGASNTSILASIGPISTIIMASIFLDEKVSAYLVIGTVIVIGGIVLISTSRKV